MAQRSFEVTALVPVPPESAIDFLTDLSRHRGLHPYLVGATITDQGASEAGPWVQWRIHERPRWGPLRYSIRFGARLTRTSPTAFASWVLAAPGCTIEAVTTARPGDVAGSSVVHEHATVTAPAPLLSYMSHHAELAHVRTFRALPEALV